MSRPVYTFSAGPCIFPLEILKRVQAKMPWMFNLSSDSNEFQNLVKECKNLLKELLSIPDNYEIFFMQGGATSQFATMAQNFLGERGNLAEYIVTGTWSRKAATECELMGGKSLRFMPDQFKVNILCLNII